jgi:hypothetical protein
MRMPALSKANFPKLVELKNRTRGCKPSSASAAWADSEKFSDAALTDESRKTFAKSWPDFAGDNGSTASTSTGNSRFRRRHRPRRRA